MSNSVQSPSSVFSADLPVVVIGAGPIGLAAAAHLARRGEPFLVLEAGATAASSVREWSHVRLFTPWTYTIDPAARELLDATGWTAPDPDAYPTGGELVADYLQPLALHPALAPHLRYGHRVTAIAHESIGKSEEGREEDPFIVQVERADGASEWIIAGAVIDASGSWTHPNPMGANGLVVPGERELHERIRYGVPDVLGSERGRYAGKRTLVVGSGHSALNSLQSLVALAADDPAVAVHWALRRDPALDDGCDDDVLTERTLLRRDVREMMREGAIQVHPNTRVSRVEDGPEGIVVWSGDETLPPVDEVIVATGFRPDLSIARELRLDVHSVYESTYALAPLIDPDANACGTVPPHGAAHLAHPEPDFYIVGMKSYGRAPTFLLWTGYEQVRSVVCALVGDEAALTVELELPRKGLCAACTAWIEEREVGEDDDCSCADETDATHAAACCPPGQRRELASAAPA